MRSERVLLRAATCAAACGYFRAAATSQQRTAAAGALEGAPSSISWRRRKLRAQRCVMMGATQSGAGLKAARAIKP